MGFVITAERNFQLLNRHGVDPALLASLLQKCTVCIVYHAKITKIPCAVNANAFKRYLVPQVYYKQKEPMPF